MLAFRISALATVSGVTLAMLTAPASAVPQGATRVSFTMPKSGEVHRLVNRFPLSGVAQQWDGTRWVPLDGAHIRFYWHMKGKKAWQRDVETWSGQDGSFRTVTGVAVGTWVMQARIVGEAGIPASTSAIRTTTLKDQVRFKDLKAWHPRDHTPTQVIGEMTDYIGGYEFTSVRGKVKLYYRRKGHKTWHYYKTTTLRPRTRSGTRGSLSTT